MQNQPSSWFLYIIRLENQNLYTGITTNVEQRLQKHESGNGAKYLRGKGKLTLVYFVEVGEKTVAAKLEYALKQLSKQQKERLVNNQPVLNELLKLINTQK